MRATAAALAAVRAAVICGCAALRPGSPAEELLPEIDIIQLRTDASAALDSVKALRAEIERLQRELAALQNRSGQVVPSHAPAPADQPQAKHAPLAVRTPSESELYDEGLTRFRARDYTASAAAFSALLGTYPAGMYVENARYWLGECRYAQGLYQEALADFRAVIGPPVSEKEDDALLKAGLCCLRLGREAEARDLFQRLLRDFPASEYAERARGYLAAGR